MPAPRARAWTKLPRPAAALIALGVSIPWAAHASVGVSLSGTVFNDLNGDQSSDGGTDPGLPGVTINLLDSTNTIAVTTTTDAAGAFVISSPGLGAYTVVEVAPAGWVETFPAGNSHAIPTNTTQDISGLDFGNFELVTVSGSIYDDLNGNGSQNAGEPGLQAREADVVDGSASVVGSATSDASGNYTVSGIGPGSFTLHVVALAGETVTQPSFPDYYSFTSSSGVNVVGGIFGLNGVAPVPEPLALPVFGVALFALGAVRRARR